MPRTGSSVAGRQDLGRTTWSVDLVRVGADGSLHWLRVWPPGVNILITQA